MNCARCYGKGYTLALSLVDKPGDTLAMQVHAVCKPRLCRHMREP